MKSNNKINSKTQVPSAVTNFICLLCLLILTGYLSDNKWISNETGAGISSFGYILGTAMFVIFMVLWITSFNSVHRRMGTRKWKRVQQWAYVLYMMIFASYLILRLRKRRNDSTSLHQ